MRRKTTGKIFGLGFVVGLVLALSGSAAAQNGKLNGAQSESIKTNDAPADIIIRDSRGNGYRGVSNQTGVAAESLREWYDTELQLNPKLTFGHFVAANVIAKNHQGLAAQAILTGLRGGKTLGQVLRAEGWDKNKIKAERKRLKREIHGKEDYAYRDNGKDWKFQD